MYSPGANSHNELEVVSESEKRKNKKMDETKKSEDTTQHIPAEVQFAATLTQGNDGNPFILDCVVDTGCGAGYWVGIRRV
jgi:hypothetical protein